ncbi:MAG: shikimate dehydrogenase [Bacteroidales bacterium]|nr:shikimate dehydrogenase [Bacteroidales bacterium]
MRKFGLIGKSLTHSFSKSYFTKKFEIEGIGDAVYQLYSLATIDEFKTLIKDNKEIVGLNVTIPYKTEIIPFLDDIDKSAQEIGAVNTIRFDRTDKGLRLLGFNTDYLGFLESIKPLLKKDSKALILGTGGSSKAVAYALDIAGVEFVFVSRTPYKNQLSYNDLNKSILDEYNVIINTTPLGMFPDEDRYPKISYQYLSSRHILYDLIYNPEKTKFLNFGEQKGVTIKNGLEMLKIQANYSWGIWNRK